MGQTETDFHVPSGAAASVFSMRPVQVTVSGSFRQAMGAVQAVVEEFANRDALVLSPADPRVVDAFGDFVFVASDRVRHIRTVQGRHFAAIAASDFLWLVAPDGYVGVSAAMEIGYAVSRDIPVFSSEVPSDLTVRQWVDVVPNPAKAIEIATSKLEGDHLEATPGGGVVLSPAVEIEASYDDLLIAQRGLLGKPNEVETKEAEAAIDRINRRTLLPF
jgi:hypothetical protein